MFHSILIPTDGSALSDHALREGLDLARVMGGKAVALHVTEPFHVFAADPTIVTPTRDEFERNAAATDRRIFDAIESQAREAGVSCTCVARTGAHVWQEIIKAAEDSGCDAICMASHGRSGLAAVVVGSETNKVLTHTRIPVVVVH